MAHSIATCPVCCELGSICCSSMYCC